MTTPTLENVIERAVRYYLAEVNTAIPAEVVSYDPDTQSCSVKPGVRRQYKDETVAERATITDVPVVFPGGGGGLLSFPIETGDTVLLVFSQRSIDRWVRGSGKDVVPGDNRKHAYADAIAIPGLVPFGNADSPDPDAVELKFGASKVRLTKLGEVEITAAQKVTMITPLLEVQGAIAATAGGISAAGNITATGDITIDGSIEATEVTASGGIALTQHKHTITSGSSAGTTTGPIP